MVRISREKGFYTAATDFSYFIGPVGAKGGDGGGLTHVARLVPLVGLGLLFVVVAIPEATHGERRSAV